VQSFRDHLSLWGIFYSANGACFISGSGEMIVK